MLFAVRIYSKIILIMEKTIEKETEQPKSYKGFRRLSEKELLENRPKGYEYLI